jgi:hypothetical protein
MVFEQAIFKEAAPQKAPLATRFWFKLEAKS